jgi:hypothetical protein
LKYGKYSRSTDNIEKLDRTGIRYLKCVTFFREIGPSMFEGEALGLQAMYNTKSIRVPLPYKVNINI